MWRFFLVPTFPWLPVAFLKSVNYNDLRHICRAAISWHGACLAKKVIPFIPGEPTMSDPAQVLKPVMEDAPREILDLAEAIATLPLEYRLRVEPLVNRVLDNAKRRRRILSLVQDALGQLRLDMKYLTFDLEATRRERDEFRQKLEG
jgi:hypothetical protein